jgi:hypothetical protein
MVNNFFIFLFQMFEFSNWQIEEPEIDDASKYDNLVPAVVKSPASDMVRCCSA